MSERKLRSLLITIIATAVVLLIQGLTPLLTPPTSPIPTLSPTIIITPSPTLIPSIVTDQPVLVTKVIDGDTLEIEGGSRVRLIGIDTPETVDPRRPVGCFGHEASNKTKSLIEGKKVRMESDITNLDKYGRLLRYIWLDNLFINELLVRDGYAYSSSYPPDIRYQGLFDAAEVEAKTLKRGLWGSCPTR